MNESSELSSDTATPAPPTTKNYVNVSNVFSCLNEYVNAELDIKNINDEKSSSSDDEPPIKKNQRKLKRKQRRGKYVKSESSSSSHSSHSRSSISSQSSDDDKKTDDKEKLIKENLSSSLSYRFNPDDSSATFNIDDLSSLSPMMKIDEPSKNDDPSVKMIAFESTMDDVSDTELESYLQELELEQTNDCKTTKQIDNISQASTVECNDPIDEPIAPKRPTTLELTETCQTADVLTEEDGAVGLPATSDSDLTPSTIQQNDDLSASQIHLICLGLTVNQLGKIQPYWMPDNTSNTCMQCQLKFSLIKRRHHCRACGQVLCSQCCSLRAKLDYLGDIEARVCIKCDVILNKNEVNQMIDINDDGTIADTLGRSPNPNNPMEYCSIVPPHQQVLLEQRQQQISVMVPVGVLKREGAPKTSRKEKNVIFSDGIRPGCDLTELDHNWESKQSSYSKIVRKTDGNKRVQTPTGNQSILQSNLFLTN